jgi:hypothetical protein
MPTEVRDGRVIEQPSISLQRSREQAEREQHVAAAAEKAERERSVAAYQEQERRRLERERKAAEVAAVERDRILAPWRKARDRLAHLLDRADEQLTRAEARADRDPLSIPKALELLGAKQAVEKCEAKVNAHDQVKPA